MTVLIDGLVAGAQLAILAAGLSLVFGLARIVNLAFGQVVVVAAVAINAALVAGMPAWLASLVGIAVGAGLAWVIEAWLLRGLRRFDHEARVVTGLLATLALAFMIDGLLVTSLPYTALSMSVGSGPVDVLGVRLRAGSLVALAVAVAGIGLAAWGMLATGAGRSIRAVRDDAATAAVTGIDPVAARQAVAALSGALAALAAISRGLSSSVGTADGFELTLLALIVAVVGGLGSAHGAAAAGLVLGVVQVAVAAWLGSAATMVLLMLVAALVVVVRPAGLLGTRAPQ